MKKYSSRREYCLKLGMCRLIGIGKYRQFFGIGIGKIWPILQTYHPCQLFF